MVQKIQEANQQLIQAFDELNRACPASKGYHWALSAANTPLLVSYSYEDEEVKDE